MPQEKCDNYDTCKKQQGEVIAFKAASEQKISAIESHAKDIRESVLKIENALGSHVRDIYLQIGKLTETMNTEVQHRMTADSNIERTLVAKIDATEVCILDKTEKKVKAVDAKADSIEKDKIGFKAFGIILTTVTALLLLLQYVRIR